MRQQYKGYQMLLVSIYMPTKNRVESLTAAVESVLSQTYENIELIIVDDASTDGTSKYLQELVKTNEKVKFIRNEESKGACHARNLAIKIAQGEFVTGLDDDDEFINTHISALVDYWQLLAKHSVKKPSCIYPENFYRKNANLYTGAKVNRVEWNDIYRQNYLGNQIFAPREHFIEAGLFDEKMPAWQDVEFFFRVVKMFGTARLLDIPTYVFDITPRPDRISVGQKDKILKACHRMIKLHADKDNRAAQYLLLQVYTDHYGFQVTPRDFLNFAKRGIWLEGYAIMISRIWKTNISRIFNSNK